MMITRTLVCNMVFVKVTPNTPHLLEVTIHNNVALAIIATWNVSWREVGKIE
jgi:hypothetical protein